MVRHKKYQFPDFSFLAQEELGLLRNGQQMAQAAEDPFRASWIVRRYYSDLRWMDQQRIDWMVDEDAVLWQNEYYHQSRNQQILMRGTGTNIQIDFSPMREYQALTELFSLPYTQSSYLDFCSIVSDVRLQELEQIIQRVKMIQQQLHQTHTTTRKYQRTNYSVVKTIQKSSTPHSATTFLFFEISCLKKFIIKIGSSPLSNTKDTVTNDLYHSIIHHSSNLYSAHSHYNSKDFILFVRISFQITIITQKDVRLMKQSKAFKVTAALSILCFVAGLVLMIVYPFADCGYQTTLPNNCQDLSSQCPYTCPDYQLTFCCRWNSTLGDYTTCFLKPETPRVEKHFRSCKAVRIVGSTLLGICFCLKVITIFIFFRLKKQNKRNSQILQRIYYIPPTPIYNNISFDRVQQPNLLHNAGKMHPQKQLEHKLDDRILEVNPSVNQQDDKFVQVEK